MSKLQLYNVHLSVSLNIFDNLWKYSIKYILEIDKEFKEIWDIYIYIYSVNEVLTIYLRLFSLEEPGEM